MKWEWLKLLPAVALAMVLGLSAGGCEDDDVDIDTPSGDLEIDTDNGEVDVDRDTDLENDAEDALERTGEAIKEGAQDAARETGEALERAGEEIRDAAK